MKVKNRQGVYHPERYCPICGSENAVVPGHQCSVSVLRAIDAANTRAFNEDINPEYAHPFLQHEPDLAQRLSVGFGLLDDDEPKRAIVL